MPDGGWRFASASVTGTSHAGSGTGCQDAHAVLIIPADGGDVLVIAVSDGAGTARAGDIGAIVATQAICEQAAEWFHSGRRCEEIDHALAREWLNGAREQIADRAAEAEADMRDYACTLLVAVVGEKHVAFLQIGDGAIVCRDQEPDWAWVFWPQHGPYVNTTYFATDDLAHTQLQFSCGSRRITEIAMFSDGLENLALHHPTRSAHDPFFNGVFKPLRASRMSGWDEKLSKFLSEYLASPVVTQRTNDDVTLVLATRMMMQGPAPPSEDEPAHHEPSD
jgi:hypothetical protein